MLHHVKRRACLPACLPALLVGPSTHPSIDLFIRHTSHPTKPTHLCVRIFSARPTNDSAPFSINARRFPPSSPTRA